MNTPSMLPASPQPAPSGGIGSAFSPVALLKAARKHWLLVCLVTALGVGGASAYTATRTPIFAATATLQLDPQALMPLGPSASPAMEGPETYWSHREYFATQTQIITSRKVAGLVVKRLGLNKDAAFLANVRGSQGLPNAQVSVEHAAEVLRSRLTVKFVEQSRLANVTLYDADPERAQRVVSTVADVYVDQNLDSALDSAGRTAEWLDTQLGKLKTDLESQEMELHDFKKRNNLLSVSYDDQSNMLRAQIQQLNTALTELQTKREAVASKLNVLDQIDLGDVSSIPQSELFSGATLKSLRESYLAAKTELAQLLALGKGDQHPDVLSARTEMEAARTALNAELKNIRAGVAADLAAVQRELAGVSSLYEGAKKQALDLNINELKYTRLRRSKDNTERTFGMVLERSTESGLSKLMPFNNVRVLDRPLKPGGPVEPRPAQNLAFGAALGLLLGLLGAVGRELLDRTVRSAEEVEAELGIPSLGSLPDSSAGAGGPQYGAYYGHRDRSKRAAGARERSEADPGQPELMVHLHPRSAAAESARGIRTNLLFMSPDKPFKSVLVTSAGPAEGKTTVATSLAIAVAQTGRRVCLVDCDLRRPRVGPIFDLKGNLGVSTAILEPEQLDRAAVETCVPNLWVLPSGPTPPNPADLMHSEAFGRLLAELTQRFDQIVVDSPPICVVTDAAVASTRLDATVLVVRTQRTRRDATHRALRTLRDVGANCLGFVMNATVERGQSYRYSYYRADADDAEGDRGTNAAAS